MKERTRRRALAVALLVALVATTASVGAVWRRKHRPVRALVGSSRAAVRSLAFGTDELAVGRADGTLEVWPLASSEAVAVVRSAEAYVHETVLGGAPGLLSAFDPTGTRFALDDGHAAIELWSVPDRTLVGTMETGSPSSTDLALSRNGERLARVSDSNKSIEVWSTSTRTRLCTLGKNDSYNYYDVALSPDGTNVAGLKITVGAQIDEWRVVDGAPIGGPRDTSVYLVTSPREALLAGANHSGRQLQLWPFPGAAPLAQLDLGGDHPLEKLAFSNAGKRVVVVTTEDLQVWSVVERRRLALLPLPRDDYHSTAVALSDEENLIALGDSLGHLWLVPVP